MIRNKNEIVLNDKQRTIVQTHALEALIAFDKICRRNGINYTLAYGTLIGAVRHKGFIPWDDDIDVCVSRKDLSILRIIANEQLPKGFFYQSHKTDKNWFRLYDKIRVDNTIFREIAHENENIHQGVYIDVFVFDYISSNKLIERIQSFFYKIISSILSAKYISVRQRHGLKKILSYVLRALFSLVKKEWLYTIAEGISCFYSKGDLLKNFESPYHDIIHKSYFEQFIDVKFENHTFMSIEKYDSWLKSIYGNYLKLPPIEKRVTTHALSEIEL